MAKIKKSAIKKDARGMLMGRGALEKFKDLIQTIKSEEGIDFGDDEGFDTLLEFYMNCIEEYNAMVNGEGPQFYASTKKSKIKKSAGLDRIWQDWMNVSDEEAEAITDVFDEYGLDFDNVGGLIQLASDKVDGKRASTKKSKVKKSISQDMEMYGGQINVSAGPGRGSQNWDFTDYCLELEDAEDESALDDLYEKIDRGETSFCIHRNDGWDYDIMVIKSTKKSKMKKGWPNTSKAYENMWEKYVPKSGEANTTFGEVLRCASRVIYRYYNDGDIYNMGYGKETINPPLKYLKNQNEYYEIKSIAEEISNYVKENRTNLKWCLQENINNTGYDALLNKLSQAINTICEEKEAEDSKAESEEASYYASTKKSIPKSNDTKMSFTENVNKMRVNNYAKIGNINTVMKKRD